MDFGDYQLILLVNNFTNDKEIKKEVPKRAFFFNSYMKVKRKTMNVSHLGLFSKGMKCYFVTV